MKALLDWKTRPVVEAFNEVSLWSAPFATLLLENIPMKQGAHVLDIGFGTGFPLLELSQRFDEESTIYGIDVWKEAIAYTQQKAKILKLQNIKIIEQSAEQIPLETKSVDLVTSNLGINNFDKRTKVIQEIRRVLKPDGTLCLTTNPEGTFEELEAIFQQTLQTMNLSKDQMVRYFKNRGTETSIIEEFTAQGFEAKKVIRQETSMRFLSGLALLNHSLIRIAFRASWEGFVESTELEEFFKHLINRIDQVIAEEGEFCMKIPMLYLEFKKDV